MLTPNLSNALNRMRAIEERMAALDKITSGEVKAPTGTSSPALLEAPRSEQADFEAILNQFKGNTGAAPIPPSALEAMAEQEAAKQGLDSSLVKAVIQAESAFNPTAKSSAGALGLMQLMPGTAAELGVSNPLNPAENVKGGVKYLKGLVNKYQSLPLALAAYNAGPGNVDKYGGVPPFQETKNYVNRVLQLKDSFSEE